MDRTKLRGEYAKLLGLRGALPQSQTCESDLAHDFQNIVNDLEKITGDSFAKFLLSPDTIYKAVAGRGFCYVTSLRSKVLQLISFLEHVYHASESIIVIGSIYNSIKDQELKDRCSDLLSAPGNFDRAINQATSNS